MKLKYNSFLLKFSLISMIFGLFLCLLNLIFLLIFKENVYIFSLIFVGIITLLVLFSFIYIKKKSYSIDNENVYFSKNKIINFKKENIVKIKLVDDNTYCYFFDNENKEIVKLPIKSFSDEEKEKLVIILKQFEIIK